LTLNARCWSPISVRNKSQRAVKRYTAIIVSRDAQGKPLKERRIRCEDEILPGRAEESTWKFDVNRHSEDDVRFYDSIRDTDVLITSVQLEGEPELRSHE
jgi:hypothetical protein